MQILTIGLSIISLILSIRSLHQNKKINRTNLYARIYNNRFDVFLVKRIPQAHNYLRFNNENKLVDAEELSKVLTDLIRDTLYFRYANKKFYDALCNQIKEIEDYVLECGNKCYFQEEQAEVFYKIYEKLEKLYNIINKNYIGNNMK